MTESEKKIIIRTVLDSIYILKLKPTTLVKADLLLSASIEFVTKEKWEHAEVCNSEAIELLEPLMEKIKENQRIFLEKIALNKKV